MVQYVCPDCHSPLGLRASVKVWTQVHVLAESWDSGELGVERSDGGDIEQPVVLHNLNCRRCGWKEGEDWQINLDDVYSRLKLRRDL